MKLQAFRIALIVAAAQAALLPAAWAGGDGSTSRLIDQPGATSPGATAETIAAYSFIAQRTLNAHSNMIEGQHLGGPGDLGAVPGSRDDVFDMQNYRIPSATMPGLNAYPRLVGARYDANVGTGAHAVYTLSGPMIAQINVKLEGIYNTYHSMVAVTATPRNPWDQTQGRLPALGQGSLADLRLSRRTPGGPANPPTAADLFWADIDTIGTGLAGLKDANGHAIPVLFRPFAEFNTNKYYYKGQNAQDFVNLWSDVVGYYKDTLHLHNLIYCWEAWTWGSSASEASIAPWYPAGKVDLVGGAFYFTQQDKAAGYFNLAFGQPGSQTQQNLNDQAVFNNLMGVAVANDKPFGAMQWAVDSTDGTVGDDLDTLAFMSSVDARRAASPGSAQHMAFNYYWTTAEEANNQNNPSALVDDPRVATVSSLDGVQAKQGAILESSAGSQVGGGQPVSTLQTGFSSTRQQYRTILSFAAGTLPANAAIDPANGLTLLMSPVTPGAASPFSVAGQRHCVDAGYLGGAPTFFGSSAALATEDFSAAGAACVSTTNDWSTNAATGRAPANFSAASLAAGYLNLKGPTQLRVYFTQPQAGGLVVWNGAPVTGLNTGDDPAPQLIFSYTTP